MNAVRIHEYGGPEVLRYEEVSRPKPGPGEVLIRVRAAGVNPLDWKFRNGYVKDLVPLPLPAIPGWEFSGVVEATGDFVDGLRPGDEVFGNPDFGRGGAYAEYIVVQDSEVTFKPKALDHIHAAAVPMGALTAWQSLFEVAGLCAGQKVLIHGAAGGVGSFAVQLAKWRGAYVIGTASQSNHHFLVELGADQTIDYHAIPFEDKVGGVDVVLDTVGGHTQQRSWKVLKPGGFMVSVVASPSAGEALAHGAQKAFVFVQPNAVALHEIAKLVNSGKIRSFVQTVLPLCHASVAQELSQTHHARGKIVLRVD